MCIMLYNVVQKRKLQVEISSDSRSAEVSAIAENKMV